MTVNIVSTIASIAFGLVGMVVGIIGIRQAYKSSTRAESREVRTDSQDEGALKSDVSYIKRRVDDVLLEQKDTNKTLTEHSERLTRVEESSKQAHKRIDGLERRINGDE